MITARVAAVEPTALTADTWCARAACCVCWGCVVVQAEGCQGDQQLAARPPLPCTAAHRRRRARGLFIAFGVLAGLSVFLACAALLDWPAVAKPLTLALLVLALLSWILVLALTVVLRCALHAGGLAGRCRWPP